MTVAERKNGPKYKQAAAVVRDQIADGVLAPGASAPNGAALARMTGYSTLTCRRALQTLIRDGVLVPGLSRNSRPRVPSPGGHEGTLTDIKRELSAALAEHRHVAGLTQPQLAEVTGDSVTTIGHAETGRLWQSRPFWERADKALNANGELLRLHDLYKAAEVPPNPAVVIGDTVLGTPDTPEVPPTVKGPPTSAIIQVVWSDGVITAVPIIRQAQ